MIEKRIRINDLDISVFGANILSLDVGAHVITNPHHTYANRLRPLKLKEEKSSRNLKLSVEFFGEYEEIVAERQSNFTKYLLENELEIHHVDGFIYHCTLSGIGDIERVASFIYVTTYNLVGYRHKDLVEIRNISSGTSIEVEGNEDTEAIIEISGSGTNTVTLVSRNRNGINESVEYEVDCTSIPIIIDGEKKTVTQNGLNVFRSKVRMTSFPKLRPGENTIVITRDDSMNDVSLSISYLPVFI